MIQVAPGTKVYLACRPVSMRYGFDGLAAQAKRVVDGDPFSGHLFLFRSKNADYLKILYYDGTGLCVSYPQCLSKEGSGHAFLLDTGSDRGAGLAGRRPPLVRSRKSCSTSLKWRR